jgi:hypothetical protein
MFKQVKAAIIAVGAIMLPMLRYAPSPRLRRGTTFLLAVTTAACAGQRTHFAERHAFQEMVTGQPTCRAGS